MDRPGAVAEVPALDHHSTEKAAVHHTKHRLQPILWQPQLHQPDPHTRDPQAHVQTVLDLLSGGIPAPYRPVDLHKEQPVPAHEQQYRTIQEGVQLAVQSAVNLARDQERQKHG